MKKLMFVILLLTISCKEGKKKFVGIDAAFESYVQSFEDEHGVPLDPNITMGFDESLTIDNGMCYFGTMEVSINPDNWEYLNNSQREALIFHELGHCALGKQHIDEYERFDGILCPKSIMNHLLFTSANIVDCYEDNYEYYMEELFGF